MAAYSRDEKSLNLLLESGADPNLQVRELGFSTTMEMVFLMQYENNLLT